MKKSKLAEDLKEELKEQIEKQHENESVLIIDIKKRLDYNGDQVLNKDDVIELIHDYLDSDNNGKISLWEYIAFIFRVIRICKKLKK